MNSFKNHKPLFVTSSNLLRVDEIGNRVIYKAAKINGDNVVLQFVVRSEKDVEKSRHQSYQLLVP